MIRVMLVDDHRMVRSALRVAIDKSDDIRVVAEASSGEQAVATARESAVHVVLMDLSMPGIGGLEATRQLCATVPGIKVIVVSAHLDEPYPSRMLAAGAAGYVGKDSDFDDVLVAIRKVYAGGRYLAVEVASNLAANFAPGGSTTPFEQLSQREVQVMLLILEGQTTPAIAEKLNISPKTVSTYHHRLLEKLNVSNDVALTRMALRYGVLDDLAAS